MRDRSQTGLPTGWAVVPLGQEAEVQLGKMLSQKAKTGGPGRPYLRNLNVRWQHFDLGNVAEMEFSDREVKKYELREGDVLVCEGGKPGRAAVWGGHPAGMLYQKALHRVRLAKDILLPQFLAYQLEHAAFSGRLAAHFTGSTIKHLPREALLECRVRVPPQHEQRRILDVLEGRLAELNAAVGALERARANLKRYRASVLRACWDDARNDANGGISISPVADLVAAPLANGRSVPSKPGGFPVLRLTALQSSGVDLAEFKEGAWTRAEALPFIVAPGDFLVARGNGSLDLVGRGALARDVRTEVAFPDTMIRLRLDTSRVDPDYFELVWSSSPMRRQVEAAARTTAGIYKISQRDIAHFRVPFPNLGSQGRIAAVAQARLSAVERAGALLEASLRRAARLRQSVLKLAFEGRLVPQDPEDEPAGALLERIRAERWRSR